MLLQVPSTTNLKLRTASTYDPKIRLGDILNIHYPTTADAEATDIVGQVTKAPASFTTATNNQEFTVNVVSLVSGVLTPVAPIVSDVGTGSITKIGRVQDPSSHCSQLDRNVNIYSFALKPEEHQPSGTCNFSRIDSARLKFTDALTTKTTANSKLSGTDQNEQTINVYAVNYNVLRIMSGMGGLAYSN